MACSLLCARNPQAAWLTEVLRKGSGLSKWAHWPMLAFYSYQKIPSGPCLTKSLLACTDLEQCCFMYPIVKVHSVSHCPEHLPSVTLEPWGRSRNLANVPALVDMASLPSGELVGEQTQLTTTQQCQQCLMQWGIIK